MIRAMERFDAVGRTTPSRETAPATAPPSPKATMTQKVLAMFGAVLRSLDGEDVFEALHALFQVFNLSRVFFQA
jgi:hypothetical protein